MPLFTMLNSGKIGWVFRRCRCPMLRSLLLLLHWRTAATLLLAIFWITILFFLSLVLTTKKARITSEKYFNHFNRISINNLLLCFSRFFPPFYLVVKFFALHFCSCKLFHIQWFRRVFCICYHFFPIFSLLKAIDMVLFFILVFILRFFFKFTFFLPFSLFTIIQLFPHKFCSF